MNAHLQKALAKEGAPHWNQLSALERLRYILTHQDVFLSADLVRPGELLAARVAPESAQEYIIQREESPFFSSLDIKKPLKAQKAPGILERIFSPA